VQPSPGSDVFQGKPLLLVFEELVVLWGAEGLNSLPEFAGLGLLAGSRLRDLALALEGRGALFALLAGFHSASVIDQPVAEHFQQESSQALPVGKLPLGLGQFAQDMHPSRLHQVNRIELRAQKGREVAAGQPAQVGFVFHKELGHRSLIASPQLLQ
jgi:hypothetical protein